MYNEDASDNIVEPPRQQFYDGFARRMVKLPTQEYYDAYACYLLLESYLNDSSKTLVDPVELRIFFLRCICGRDLFQATRFERENDTCKYKFLPHNLVQTILLEYNRLPYDRRSLERSSDQSSDKRFDGGSRDGGSRGRQSSIPRRPSSSGPTSRFIPEHQNAFLQKLSTQSGLTLVEHLLLIISAV